MPPPWGYENTMAAMSYSTIFRALISIGTRGPLTLQPSWILSHGLRNIPDKQDPDKQVGREIELRSSSPLDHSFAPLSLDTLLTSLGLIWINRENITVLSGWLCKLNKRINAQNITWHIVGDSYLLTIFSMVNKFILIYYFFPPWIMR